MKKYMRYIFKAISLFILLLLTYFLVALALSYTSTHPKTHQCPKNHQIYLSSNGVHLDIIMPIETIPESLRNQLTLPTTINYVAFGWGDKGFYLNTPTWADLTVTTGFNALFWKSPSVMHLTYYKNKYASWLTVDLCPTQIAQLNTYITASFQYDAQQHIQILEGAGYTSYDFFYQAKGSYSFINTCNVWANRALQKAEVKTAIYTPFDFGILHHFKN